MFKQSGDESRTTINTDDARKCKHRRYVDQARSSGFGGPVFGWEDPNISRKPVDNAAVVDVAVDIGLKWTHEIHCNSVEWIIREEGSIEDVSSTRDTPCQLAVWARLDEGDEVTLH